MIKEVKKVCVITGSRAEYGLLKPVMEKLRSSKLEFRLIVSGMHLCHEFGSTYKEIERDGFNIDSRVEMTLSADTNAAMTKSIGIGIAGMTQALDEINPDVVLVLGDRVEAFAGAVSGAGLNKVVAHIHGGDITRGGLDDSMRHAITKFAHLHFAATEKSRDRIIRMGENPDRVYTVGAPGLDSIVNANLYRYEELSALLGFSLKKPFVLAVQHPVSTHPDEASNEMRETLEALKAINRTTILIFPNSDSGGRRMIEVIESYRSERWLQIVRNIDHAAYLSLLAHTEVLVGNSSSGIIEAPSFHVPVVNIGPRQEGRERSTNVIDVMHDRAAIQKAIEIALKDAAFKSRVQHCINPYGDGTASQRIVNVLSSFKITPDLTQKQITY
jgi:GDP/UDP-N,N'-diacetylbacillosamine 2-epimerase (hydrolysing)